MSALSIKKSIYIATDAQNLWSYLTDPEKLSIWFHKPDQPLDKIDPYQMINEKGEVFMSGRVLKVEAPFLLEYEFHIEPMGNQISIVNWTINEVAGGVELCLTHKGLPDHAEAFSLITALDKGWEKHMDAMRAMFLDQ